MTGIKKIVALCLMFSLAGRAVLVPAETEYGTYVMQEMQMDEERTYDEKTSEREMEANSEKPFESESETTDEKPLESESEANSEKSFESESEANSEKPLESESEANSEKPSESESETNSENLFESESEEESFLEGEEETESESMWESEEETESESQTESEGMEDAMPYLAELESSGKTVVGASGWTQAEGINRLSSEYYPVRFYSGVSSLESFCSSNNVNQVTMSDRVHFYPTAADAAGKFGVIYRKVLYYNYQWYDLKMTVSAYSSQVRCDGGDTVKVFPFMEFTNHKIGFYFHDAIGEYVLKCEFLNAKTGAVEKVNTRFQWQDIDSAQRFGLRLSNGKVAAKYYYGNSRLYYQTGQSVAGVRSLEMVVGPPANYEAADMKNAAVYELQQCSTYYMAIGFRDHLEDDGNSLAKKNLTKWKTQLESKSYEGTKSYLQQTDSEMNIIQTPAPVKQVANSLVNHTADWNTENTLSSVRSEYLYRITQFVPWQHTNAYYERFQMKDVLPKGVDYVGEMKILRMEDGKDVASWFDVTVNGQTLELIVKSNICKNADFYGYHYEVIFKVQMNPAEAKIEYNGTKAEITVKNEASIAVKHTAESKTTELKSNQTVTTASVTRAEVPEPVKGFDKDEEAAEKILWNKKEEIMFSVFQQIPVNDEIFRPSALEMTDTLEECLVFQSCEVHYKAAGVDEWTQAEGWIHEVKGQNVRISREGCPQEYEGGTVLWQIRCRIRDGADLSAWEKKKEEQKWTEIPNRASVTFRWERGEPSSVTQETNSVIVRLQQMTIHLKKQIDAEDIVWAHGNPTFTFRVEGTDLLGKYHVWHQTVEFQKENTPGSGRTSCEAVFQVPAGVYVATELPVIRYQLKEIHSIKGGEKSAEGVLFDLSTKQVGEAVFYNEKITDAAESDTFFVKNRIG